MAGVNGGFFAVDGDPVGALAIGGRLLSEPVDGRSALIVPADPAAGRRASARSEFDGAVRAGRGRAGSRRRGAPARSDARVRRPRRRPAHRAAQLRAHVHRPAASSSLLSSRYGGSPPTTGVEALRSRGGASLERVGRPERRAGPARRAACCPAAVAPRRFLTRALPVGSRPAVDLAVRGGRPAAVARAGRRS